MSNRKKKCSTNDLTYWEKAHAESRRLMETFKKLAPSSSNTEKQTQDASKNESRPTMRGITRKKPRVNTLSLSRGNYERSATEHRDARDRFQRPYSAYSSAHASDILMQAQQEGKLKGVFGRLGDLGTIPSDVLVNNSTPNIQYLDYIVVKNDHTAENC